MTHLLGEMGLVSPWEEKQGGNTQEETQDKGTVTNAIPDLDAESTPGDPHEVQNHHETDPKGTRPHLINIVLSMLLILLAALALTTSGLVACGTHSAISAYPEFLDEGDMSGDADPPVDGPDLGGLFDEGEAVDLFDQRHL